MTQQNKSLSEFVQQYSQENPSEQQRRSSDTSQYTTQSFNTYLTVFSVSLSHRFPDVSDLDSIDYYTVRNIAQFSMVCSQIALETWDEQSPDIQQRRQRMIARTSRAA